MRWYERGNKKFQWQMEVQTIYKTMLSYCFKCRKNTQSKNTKFVKTKIGRTMLLQKCAVLDSKHLLRSKKLEDY